MFKARTAPAAIARPVDTVIGAGTEIRGSVTVNGTLRIDGYVDGEIQAQGEVVVGESGRVAATLTAANLSVAGVVDGDVTVRGRLTIAPTGRVLGNAKVGALIVEEGGILRGECDMEVDRDGDGVGGDMRRRTVLANHAAPDGSA